MLKKVRKFIRSKDIIAPSGSSQLHIRSDIDQKNLIGGIFPISIRLYVLLVALALGK
jgi:hypothetical protein